MVPEGFAQLSKSNSDAANSFSVLNDPVYGGWRESATLRAIASVTQDRLVAVGDRGTILVTVDAGYTWSLVSSPTTINLNDVYYDGQTLWSAGGWIGNKTGSSYAVLLKSDDGGLSWHIQPTQSLPRLTGIHSQGNRVICWGDYSPQLRSSVFISLDGGVTWQAETKGITHVASACVGSDSRIVAVDTLGRSVTNAHKETQLLTSPDRPLKAMVATDNGWLAGGEGGILIASRDGLNWSDIQLPIPESLAVLCDWQAIAAVDNHIWVSGSPGSMVFHSQDRGRTWQGCPTGQNLPINRMCFVDAQRGWAVGAQGTLLATRDGGRNWYPQRQQPTRVSLLSINRSPATTPWPALVAAVWDHQRSAMAIAVQHTEPLTHADSKPSSEICNVQFARQMGLADYSVCDCNSDQNETAELRLALQIAIWRPDVLLSSLSSSQPLSESNLPRSLSAAMQRAKSEDSAFAFGPLFLNPWQTQKLVEVVESGRSDYSEQIQKVLRGSGLAISDVMWLLPDSEHQGQSRVNMRTVWSRSQSRVVQSELLGGTTPSAETRLSPTSDSLGNYHSILGRAHRDKMLKQLFRNQAEDVPLEDWKREFLFFAQSLPPRDGSGMLSELVDGLCQQGYYQRSRQVLEWIMRTDPSSDLARWAGSEYLGLLFCQPKQGRLARVASPTVNSSNNVPVVEHPSLQMSDVEIETLKVATADFRLNDRDLRSVASPFTDGPQEFDVKSSRFIATDSQTNSSRVVSASAERPISTVDATQPASTVEIENDWRQSVDQVLKLLPELRFEPHVVMLLASQQRRSGNMLAAQTLLNELFEQPQVVTWHQAAQQEMSVLAKQEGHWKWRVDAAFAELPPELDGNLDETFWATADQMRLESLQKQSGEPAIVKWGYDSRYLYIGMLCPREIGSTPLASDSQQVVQQRDYDADLTNLDQIEIMLDLDRDYNAHYTFTVAENGLTRDAYLNSTAYNPKWHVKVISMPDRWQAEIAIPVAELDKPEIKAGECWATSARRLRPSRSPQSWSQLRTHLPMPQSNGLLRFN